MNYNLNKLKKINLKNFKIFKDFELDFMYEGKAQNLIVLAGINGSGKTTILRDIIFSCISKDK